MAGEPFAFAAFRSRQQTAALEAALNKQGIRCRIINTPHEIGMGCGLSIKFSPEDLNAVQAACGKLKQNALIGIYSAEYVNGRLVCKPIARPMRTCN